MNLEELQIFWEASSENKAIQAAIEREFQNRIPNNFEYSKEELLLYCNQSINIYFIPGSNAYNQYGAFVTAEVLVNDTELEELLKNQSVSKKTFGKMKAKMLVVRNLSLEQGNQLAPIEFHTNEILTIKAG